MKPSQLSELEERAKEIQANKWELGEGVACNPEFILKFIADYRKLEEALRYCDDNIGYIQDGSSTQRWSKKVKDALEEKE